MITLEPHASHRRKKKYSFNIFKHCGSLELCLKIEIPFLSSLFLLKTINLISKPANRNTDEDGWRRNDQAVTEEET